MRRFQTAGEVSLNASDLTSSYLFLLTMYSGLTVLVCVCVCLHETAYMVYLCVVVLSEIDRIEIAFILFNLSLISLVRNFNLCNKSALGYRGEKKLTQADEKCLCVCVLVNSLVCALECVCVCF